ncbi:MAG: YajQ family cyclic di-GMP-binding protein [Candidatus Omnitrophica bacterium]|nr:YajQ family cyclic di-GMP-binding protein [Candidatus Omnitrophota bacterium]
MSKDHSFDFVSKVDLQELRNALSQAQKEIQTRFDFKGSSASLQFEESAGAIKLSADHSMQLKSVRDLFETKLAKRGVSLRSFSWKEPETLPGGGMKQQADLQQGLSSEKAKEVVKTVKGLGLKVEARIEADSVRVSARQIDDLQAVIQTLRGKDLGIPLQVENYR